MCCNVILEAIAFRGKSTEPCKYMAELHNKIVRLRVSSGFVSATKTLGVRCTLRAIIKHCIEVDKLFAH